MSGKIVWSIVLFSAASVLTAGCAKPSNSVPADLHAAAGDHSHDGWWCDEHGVPEEVCSLCNVKLAADFKAKGDWCKEHDRAESQCFVCHPEKEAEFAAQYEAKYGRKPPKPESDGAKHEHKEEAKS